MQEYHQTPNVPPFLGHTVLTGLGPPTSAGGGPRSYTGLNNFQGPYDYCSPQDLVGADWGLVGALCFL